MDAKFCVFVIACVLSVHTQSGEEFCRTPNGDTGDCIAVSSCKPIMDILEAAPRPISQEIRNLLKSYQCGFDRKQVKVCCSSSISLPGVTAGTAKPEAALGGPPDVSQHRNLRLLPEDCGKIYLGDKIVFGNKTELFEFPWMALLSYRTNRGPSFQCGATVINDRYILTAAHCITQLKSPLLGVRIGEHNIDTQIDCKVTREGERICSPPHQDVAIEEIIPHPNYNRKTFTNDIGLLRVSRMDLTKENTYPVCLPLDKNRNFNFTDRNCVVTGWGATESRRTSPELLKAELPIITNEECASLYKSVTTITERQLCAGGKTRSDSCNGDSGGPLHVLGRLHGDSRMVQQGVVSFGPKTCAVQNQPGVYTRVAYYMDWILDNMRS